MEGYRSTARIARWLLFIGLMSAAQVYAACSPDQILPDSDGNPQDPASDDVVGVVENGTFITCRGNENRAIVSQQPVSGVVVAVQAGAVVAGPDNPIFLDGAGNRVDNAGTISGNDVLAGIALFGPAAMVNNNGLIDIENGIGVGIEGAGARVVNGVNGIISLRDGQPEGIFVEGAGARVENLGTVSLSGDDGEALFVEGTNSQLLNAGQIDVNGRGAQALMVDGVDTVVRNSGTIQLEGGSNLGVIGAGDRVEVTNSGTIDLQGDVGIGLGAAGDDIALTNLGRIGTDGQLSVALLGIGTAAVNVSMPNVLNAAGAQINTQQANAMGAALGLQPALIPAGVAIPPAVQAAVSARSQGFIENRGSITTSGTGADGIHAFADNSRVANSGIVAVSGNQANGIFVDGAGNRIVNSGAITAGASLAQGASGIRVLGSAVIDNDGEISSRGGMAAGIRGVGLGVQTIHIDNTGDVAVAGNSAVGLDASASSRLVIQNRGQLDVSSAQSIGIQANLADLFGEIYIENSESLMVSGANAVGARITTFADVQVATAAVSDRACSAAMPGSHIANCGAVTLRGESTVGVELSGSDLQFENLANITFDGNESVGVHLDGTNLRLINAGSVSGEDDAITNEARGVLIDGADAMVRNDGDIMLSGGDAVGIFGRNADMANIVNRSDISLIGSGAKGIDISGNQVVIENGEIGNPAADATILLRESGVVGIQTNGVSAFVSNRALSQAEPGDVGIRVEGNNSVAIEVGATGSGNYLVENAGIISASGNDARGISLVNRAASRISAGANTAAQSECLGANTGALINCGTVVVSGERSIGQAALGVTDLYVENSGFIEARGNSASGIVVGQTGSGLTSDGNLILNLDDINVFDGSGVNGILVEGDRNVVVHGQGDISFPLADAPLPDTFLVISTQIDRLTSTSDVPLFPVAGIRAEGVNASGIQVRGDNNMIAVIPVQQPDGDVLASVRAVGSGSAGIRLTGDNNLVLNQGFISGETGIVGSAGVDRIQNLGVLQGGARLEGGDDVFETSPVFTQSDLTGVVDGGLGRDLLQVNSVTLPAFQSADGRLNGDQFINFERFVLTTTETNPVGSDQSLAGRNNVTLFGDLVLDASSAPSFAQLQKNTTLTLDEGTLVASEIVLEAGSLLTGNGAIGALPNDLGAFNSSEISILSGATVSAGNSPGRLEFYGDVSFAGLLEVEIAGPNSLLFDRLFIDGDLSLLGGDIRFSFIDGFMPSLGDSFDFLEVTGDIFGFDNVNFSVHGLLDEFVFDFSAGSDGLMFSVVQLVEVDPTGVPEPSTLGMLGAGFISLLLFRSRRRC